jgi:2',3'-cyclic-nucleotide 2'-phosphodiesterase
MPVRRILFLGDICAKPGRDAVVGMVPRLRSELGADFVIANGENAAGGYGLTPEIAGEILKQGVDCITTGDHFFDKKEIAPTLDAEPRLLRPLNFPDGVPGHGSGVFDCAGGRIAVVNLLGRVFMKPSDCPFQRVMPELQRLHALTNVIVVDFHAEATAEKISMGWYLDGEVTAVLGTHTHVATADERVLPRGTAYISDVGMCGGMDSVLGMRRDLAIRRMIQNIPLHLEPTRDNLQVCGVLVEVADETGKAVSIRRIARRYIPSPEAEIKSALVPGSPDRPEPQPANASQSN